MPLTWAVIASGRGLGGARGRGEPRGRGRDRQMGGIVPDAPATSRIDIAASVQAVGW